MAIRIRSTGEILCAAHTEAMKGDIYIDDGVHYIMSVVTRCIVASENHKQDNLWFWNVPDDMKEHFEEIMRENPKKISRCEEV